MNFDLARAMREAASLTRAQKLAEATRVIQDALGWLSAGRAKRCATEATSDTSGLKAPRSGPTTLVGDGGKGLRQSRTTSAQDAVGRRGQDPSSGQASWAATQPAVTHEGSPRSGDSRRSSISDALLQLSGGNPELQAVYPATRRQRSSTGRHAPRLHAGSRRLRRGNAHELAR